jgi:hypothetical protein
MNGTALHFHSPSLATSRFAPGRTRENARDRYQAAREGLRALLAKRRFDDDEAEGEG